jgi:hypothetical protein
VSATPDHCRDWALFVATGQSAVTDRCLSAVVHRDRSFSLSRCLSVVVSRDRLSPPVAKYMSLSIVLSGPVVACTGRCWSTGRCLAIARCLSGLTGVGISRPQSVLTGLQFRYCCGKRWGLNVVSVILYALSQPIEPFFSSRYPFFSGSCSK